MEKLLVLLAAMLSFVAMAQSRIAFIALDGQVTTVEADGSDLRKVTQVKSRFQFPAWSPDGQKLAVIGSDFAGGFISLFSDQENSKEIEVYRSQEQTPFYLYWSPDSNNISFLTNHPEARIALHIASASAVGMSQLVAFGAPFYWQWTSDSQRLFVHTGLTGSEARLGFTSRVRDTLKDNLASPGLFQSPGISPTGRYITYATSHSEQGAHLIVERNAELTEDRLELAHFGLVAMTWSPIRDELAFISPRQFVSAPRFDGPLKLLDAETGLVETLSDNRSLAFFWSPDGRYIAYFTPAQRKPREVFQDKGLRHISTLQDSSEMNIQARPLKLNLFVVDVKTKEERILARFIPSPLFFRQFLPYFDQYALSHRIWSPTSDALVVPTIDPDTFRPRVSVIELEGQARHIAAGDMPFWNWR